MVAAGRYRCPSYFIGYKPKILAVNVSEFKQHSLFF